jgi:hypothetical protein
LFFEKCEWPGEHPDKAFKGMGAAWRLPFIDGDSDEFDPAVVAEIGASFEFEVACTVLAALCFFHVVRPLGGRRCALSEHPLNDKLPLL